MRTIENLIAAIRQEAARVPFAVDRPVYERAGKDPLDPVLFAGSLAGPYCIFGRDLGKDEVAQGEPLIGAGGSLVRAGLYRAATGDDPPKGADKRLEPGLALAILTNTVPYKPPGNKAYPSSVKERFRPFVAELLAGHWTGQRVLTLGTEAFQWFAPYADPGAFDAFWARADRYEADLPCTLTVETPDGPLRKPIVVAPLPHPSPLNQRWYPLFPGLLAQRLASGAAGS